MNMKYGTAIKLHYRFWDFTNENIEIINIY